MKNLDGYQIVRPYYWLHERTQILLLWVICNLAFLYLSVRLTVYPLAFTKLMGLSFNSFLDATTHLYKRSCPSVRRSVGRSVPSYFRTPNMAVFEGKKSSNDIINNGIMSDDEVVASDVPPRYLFLSVSPTSASHYFPSFLH